MLPNLTTPKTTSFCDELILMGKLYSPEHCVTLLNTLITTIDWNEDSCIIFGRRFEIPRLQAWYADNGIHYSYSNNLLTTQRWNELLSTIRRDVQQKTGYDFNSVLLTYYRHGNDHVTWHADDEEELGAEPVIASLSLGATREFQFRRKHDELQGSIYLNDGDLLLMRPGFQVHWEHCIPLEPDINQPRINLTFRKVNPPQ